MIEGQETNLLIFSKNLVLCVKFAYRSYKKPLRTALSKIFKSHLTPIYIFRGPDIGIKLYGKTLLNLIDFFSIDNFFFQKNYFLYKGYELLSFYHKKNSIILFKEQ
jgi:hypothetical protein